MLASPVSPVFKNADDIQRTGRNSRRLLVLPTDVCVALVLASGSRPLTAPPHVDPLGPPPRLSEGWFSRPDPIMPHLCQVLQCSAVSKVSFEYLSGTPKALRDRALVPRPNLVFCPRMIYHFSTSSLPSLAPHLLSHGPTSVVRQNSDSQITCPSEAATASHVRAKYTSRHLRISSRYKLFS